MTNPMHRRRTASLAVALDTPPAIRPGSALTATHVVIRNDATGDREMMSIDMFRDHYDGMGWPIVPPVLPPPARRPPPPPPGAGAVLRGGCCHPPISGGSLLHMTNPATLPDGRPIAWER